MSEQERDQLFYEFVQGRKEKVMMQQVEDEQYIMYVTRRALKKNGAIFLVINTESLITSGEEYTGSCVMMKGFLHGIKRVILIEKGCIKD